MRLFACRHQWIERERIHGKERTYDAKGKEIAEAGDVIVQVLKCSKCGDLKNHVLWPVRLPA